MPSILKVRLSVLLFFEFFVWGAWYTTIAVYMSNNGMENLTHWPFTGNAIAAIVAPFIVGMVADRYFNTEKILGTLHVLGGIILLFTPGLSSQPALFILLLILYNICYMPTMSLANSLCFHHIQNQEKEFPVIRTFGTIGWIVAGLVVSFVLVRFVAEGLTPEQTALPIYMAGGFSLLLGGYSLTLPRTPPRGKGEETTWRGLLGIDALKKLWSKSFFIFLLSSFLICIPLAVYYNFTQVYMQDAGFKNIAATQTIGQMSEVIFMIIMPLLFVRLGVKWMLAVGMFAWVLRYGLFAIAAPDAVTWMILVGIALHGICYDFFFVTGQIYVDKKADPAIKGQAQGLIIFVTYGIGMLVGTQLAGRIFNFYLGEANRLSLDKWQSFWVLPAIFALAVLLFFIFSFRDNKIEEKIQKESI